MKQSKIDVIDKFFAGLNLDNTTFTGKQDASKKVLNVPVKENGLGELMSMIDTDNRFIYIGSETTPPCS